MFSAQLSCYSSDKLQLNSVPVPQSSGEKTPSVLFPASGPISVWSPSPMFPCLDMSGTTRPQPGFFTRKFTPPDLLKVLISTKTRASPTGRSQREGQEGDQGGEDEGEGRSHGHLQHHRHPVVTTRDGNVVNASSVSVHVYFVHNLVCCHLCVKYISSYPALFPFTHPRSTSSA